MGNVTKGRGFRITSCHPLSVVGNMSRHVDVGLFPVWSKHPHLWWAATLRVCLCPWMEGGRGHCTPGTARPTALPTRHSMAVCGCKHRRLPGPCQPQAGIRCLVPPPTPPLPGPGVLPIVLSVAGSHGEDLNLQSYCTACLFFCNSILSS